MSIKYNDFLSIITGSIIIDVIILYMNYNDTVFISKKLQEWYQTFRNSALIMDILAITIYVMGGLYISSKYTNDSIYMKLLCIVIVQVIGDLIFYKFFDSLPRGYPVFDFFKDYASEMDYERNDYVSYTINNVLGLKQQVYSTGFHALWSDAILVIFATLFGIGINKLNKDMKYILLIVSVYISQYVLYLK